MNEVEQQEAKAPEAEAAAEAAAEVTETEDTDTGAEEAEGEDESEAEEDKTDYRGKLNAQNNFLKKEGYEFKDGKWVKPPKPAASEAAAAPTLSTTDIFALTNAKVHEDDVERVVKFAQDEKMSVKDALKSDELRAILTVRAEKRTTAAAANTGPMRRGPGKVTGETLLQNAKDGKLPDDDAGIAALVTAKSKEQQ